MQYHKTVRGQFVKRVNRFIAEVMVEGELERVHVKNTGRLRELLLQGAEVTLEPSRNPSRKTKYSLVAVKTDEGWVNIDSQAPNAVALEALQAGSIRELGLPTLVKREVTFGQSRFDLYYEREEKKGFIEVKGVTLSVEGMAKFPDAPTTRGTKHILELAEAVQAGFEAAVLFVVQRVDCYGFTPNREMDPAFAAALVEASEQGVQVLAYEATVREGELLLHKPLPVYL